MKKIFAVAALAVASLFGAANANAEGWFIGGSLGYWHESSNANQDFSTNTLTILPEAGYNFNSKWAVGTQIGYEMVSICGANSDGHMFQFNPYARWSYFRTSNNLVQLFLDGTVGIGVGGLTYDGDSEGNAVTWKVGVRPGVAINLTDKFSLVAHFGMVGYEDANDDARALGYSKQGGLLLNPGSIDFGFYFNF